MAPAQKRALITGITGQDGLYLAELLIGKGYQVFGLIRGQNNPKREMVELLLPAVELLEGDLGDMTSLVDAVNYCPACSLVMRVTVNVVGFAPRVRTTNVCGVSETMVNALPSA